MEEKPNQEGSQRGQRDIEGVGALKTRMIDEAVKIILSCQAPEEAAKDFLNQAITAAEKALKTLEETGFEPPFFGQAATVTSNGQFVEAIARQVSP